MPTTSLLILLVVAIWAAYLLQHWIRRREAMATARSVDRFSEAMRVLAKRDPLPQGIAPMVRARSAQRQQAPEVSVKAPRTSLRAGQHIVGDDMSSDHLEHETTPSFVDRVRGGAGGAVAKVSSLNGRQVRGISLLAALGFTVLTLLLAPFGVVSWLLPLAGLLITAGVVVWLRNSAIAQQRARAAARPARAPRRTVRTETVAAPAQVAPVTEVFGFEEPAEVTVASSTTEVVETVEVTEPVEGGWQPTAVPRPTYAMKERAPQTAVEPAATVADQPVPVQDLPFDGLALDEDLEELPAVYRAG